jgi:hypothetical protein
MVLGAGAAALAPLGPAALAPLRAAAAEIYVAVVVDFGGGPGSPTAIVDCVTVPSGSTDAQALADAVDQETAYSNSGLLCAIEGYPPNGVSNCDASSGQDYYYWSYWHGSTGSWVYANDGPAEQVVAPGDVEGWRFEDPGPANPSAAKPGPAPEYAAICPQAAGATTTTSPATSVTTTTAAPRAGGGTPDTTGPGGGSGTTGPGGGSGTTGSGTGSSPTTVPAAAGGGGGGPSTASTTPAIGPGTGGTGGSTAPGGGAKAAAGSKPAGAASSDHGHPSRTAPRPAIRGPTAHRGRPGRPGRALGDVGGARAPGGTDPWPLAVTGVIVLALGAGALLRWRRRQGAQ